MAEVRPLQFSKILVPVNGTRADDEAIRLACALARKSRAKIYAIYVIQVKRTLPLDASIEPEVGQGERVLEHAEAVAERLDYEMETEVLQSREVGPAIVDEAVERGVDIIIIGLGYKKHFGEFSLGNIAPYVLKNAPCPVLLLRESTLLAEERVP